MTDRLVSLVKYRFEHRAFFLKDILVQNGFECWISDPTVFGQIDGYIVMIKEVDYNEAHKIYLQFEKNTEPE